MTQITMKTQQQSSNAKAGGEEKLSVKALVAAGCSGMGGILLDVVHASSIWDCLFLAMSPGKSLSRHIDAQFQGKLCMHIFTA